MKKYLVIISFIAALSIIGISQYPKLSIATGYGAKCMASGVFVAGREPEDVNVNDLKYSLVQYTSSKIDYKEKSVTTSLFGLSSQKAVYREGLGCCLIPEEGGKSVAFSPSPMKRSLEPEWKLEWPAGDLPVKLNSQEIDSIQLSQAIQKAFDPPGVQNKRTAAVVVIYKGKLIREAYWKEQKITAETRLWGWSMNKSIVNTMIGVLVRKGQLSIHSCAPVKEWLADKRRNITINDLLHMSSGLRWNEDYGDISDVTRMLYKSSDCYAASIRSAFESVPNTVFKYSSGTANILSGIVRSTIGKDSLYHRFPYKEIFEKIGMNSMVLEADQSGNFVGSSYGYAKAKDWAKFGLLYLQDGVWKGDTLLPKGWVNYSITPADHAKGEYGSLFWLNRSLALPDAPTDMYSCQGHRGQRIFIIPSRNLVVVRLGFGEDNFDHNLFLKEILQSFKR